MGYTDTGPGSQNSISFAQLRKEKFGVQGGMKQVWAYLMSHVPPPPLFLDIKDPTHPFTVRCRFVTHEALSSPQH